MVIYFNPECSKCKEAKEILDSSACEYEIRNYLETAPSVNELKELVSKLGCKAEDLVRKTEPLFINEFSSNNYSEQEWIELLCENPVLLQRPIVIDGVNALIGRPPSLVLELIKNDFLK